MPLDLALRLAPDRTAAAPRPGRARIRVDDATIRRPVGTTLDSGGIGKGLFADWVADTLSGKAIAVDCGGDLRLRGTMARDVHVADPVSGETIHTFRVADGAVATSGIGRRAWLGADGRPAHHLLDPSTGRPAYTGVVQVTALAPTALEAEVRAKAALLSADHAWLAHGGVMFATTGQPKFWPSPR